MADHETPEQEPSEPLIPVFIPTLCAILLRAEKLKGSPLTETEVLRIRDKGVCVMMRADHARAMAESRGYDDINPENCWEEWTELREQLRKEEEGVAAPDG